MRVLISIILISFCHQLNAQQFLHGQVLDNRQNAVIGANIYIEGTYDGTTSNLEGLFELLITQKGPQVLKVSSIGFDTFSYSFHSDSIPGNLIVELKEKINELESVVITAGTFEDGEKKQSMVLSAFDVASTASAQGDIYGAFNSVPGAQKVGEEGRLFVRGGEAYETRTFMDGLYIANPYYSQASNIPTRGRFSPLLFEGMLFSTGGYSAEYGQALSSIVALKTTGLQKENKRSISLMSVGAGFSDVQTWDRTSLSVNGDYINAGMHNRLFGSAINWQSDPELLTSSLMLRHKTGESGLIKGFVSMQLNRMNMLYDNFAEQKLQNLTLDDRNWYSNFVYTDMVSDKWLLQSGIAYSYATDHMDLDNINLKTVKQGQHLKLKATHLSGSVIQIKTGAEWISYHYNQDIVQNTSNGKLGFQSHQLAAFAEADWQISPKLALRLGSRSEYSTLLNSLKASPRLSGAFKTGRNSQVSMAWGTFFQNPQEDYLKFTTSIDAEQSSHLIMNYQYKKENRLLRIEGYLKEYNDLVTYNDPYSINPDDYSNDGYGHSNGIELFWRDGNTFKNTDYWISYSYNDTKRLYRDYPVAVMPSYASKHNLSVVVKQFVPGWSTFFCVTYGMASRRPYHNPNNPGFMQGETNIYHDISLNATYLMQVMQKEAVIHLMINNVTGRENIFGYEYSTSQDSDGVFNRKPIVSPIKQQAVLVFLIMI